MCTDTTLSSSLLQKLQEANNETAADELTLGDPQADREEADSFSGNERNHLFLNNQGKAFADISALSGLDCPEDTRSSVLFDYDRDGWLDVALVNCNAPALGLFRNNLASESNNHVIAVRLVGGATPTLSNGYAPRDGYGGKVFLRAGGKTYLRESRAGEGFAAQNSRTLLIGIGTSEYAEELQVRWPSGKTQSLGNVSAGTLVTCYENAEESADGSGFASEPYLRDAAQELISTGVASAEQRPVLELAGTEAVDAPLRMVTTMATWCATCRGELPQLARLRDGFSSSELAMYAAPIDVNDDASKLAQYCEQNDPAYQLLADLPISQRELVQEVVKQELGTEALPATLVLNAQGEVVASFPGVPTVSALRRLLVRP